jgi:hypothetical protein
MADIASAKKARKAMVMLADEVSTNATAEESVSMPTMPSIASLKRFVKEAAEDAADINRYAII